MSRNDEFKVMAAIVVFGSMTFGCCLYIAAFLIDMVLSVF